MPRRVLEGKVVSDKANKTITVSVERRVKDKLYSKVIRRTAKFTAHDENNTAKLGDVVSIEECKPISKSKSWTLVTGEADTKKVEAKKAPAKKAAPKKAVKKTEDKK